MKSTLKFVGAVAAGLLAAASSAMAAPILDVPEPGSLMLVGVAVAGLIVASRKAKK